MLRGDLDRLDMPWSPPVGVVCGPREMDTGACWETRREQSRSREDGKSATLSSEGALEQAPQSQAWKEVYPSYLTSQKCVPTFLILLIGHLGQ